MPSLVSDEFADLLLRSPARMSAANWLETAMVVGEQRTGRYGRGSGSPARLHFGDCLTYGLSAVTGESLLFKGDNFTHTDVLRAR